MDLIDRPARRRVRRRPRLAALAPLALVAVGTLAVAAPAQAHVTLQPGSAVAGSTVTLELAVEHGCDGAATTALAVRLPEDVSDVRPLDDPRWDATAPTAGSPATVTFRAVTPIPDGQPASVALSVRLPEEEGVLVLPTVQSCEGGELAWLEATADGSADDSLELPAPTLRVTAAGAPEEGGGAGLAVGVVGVGLLGSAVVGGMVARQRRRS